MKKELIKKMIENGTLAYNNPFIRNYIVIDDKAMIELGEYGNDYGQASNALELRYIKSFEYNKGYASEVLKKVCNAADELGYKMVLCPKPVGKGGLKKVQLIKWYGKSGFKKLNDYGKGLMIRLPK